MTAVNVTMLVKDGWKPILPKTACAGINSISATLTGTHGRAVPWGGAKAKYAMLR